MGFTINPAAAAYSIINNDTSLNPDDGGLPYWIPHPNATTGYDVGPYYNVSVPTTEIFSYIEFVSTTNNVSTAVTSGFYKITAFDATLSTTDPNQTVLDNGTVLTGSIVSGQTYPLSSITFTPDYTAQLQPSVTIVLYSDSTETTTLANATYLVLCFAAGTLIDCPGEARAIETLRAGDLVVNAQGLARKVLFIGRRTLDLRHARNHAPVRIPANAISDGVPSRDLRLSPDHAVMMGGVLIPARCLIGDVVTQDEVDHVTYYHIQLDTHDIVMAEGMPCETLLTTDDPSDFDNADEAVITDAFLSPCLPRVTQGPEVEAARVLLRSRMMINA